MYILRIPIIIIGCLAFAAQAAASVCVKCSGPAASYACTVKKADEIEALAGAKAINKICMHVLKRKGQHSACQVVEGQCSDPLTTISWKDVKAALAAGDETPDVPPAKSKEAVSPPATPKQSTGAVAPPANVAPVPTPPPAAAANADASPGKAPPPADPTIGENIKGAAEKTWNCVSSFFGKC